MSSIFETTRLICVLVNIHRSIELFSLSNINSKCWRRESSL